MAKNVISPDLISRSRIRLAAREGLIPHQNCAPPGLAESHCNVIDGGKDMCVAEPAGASGGKGSAGKYSLGIRGIGGWKGRCDRRH